MSDAERALPEFDAALRPGTRLGEFEIRRQLGAGGFGIVYLAFDHTLEREVAIKEYMPASMAGRTQALQVSLRSGSDAEVFALGLRSFINEAKLLARFDHPSLIKVHRFWEANDTAYMVMPVLRGPTFQEIRRSTGRSPGEAWVRSALGPLLEALEQLHREGVYHRDISPDNIHLESGGRPVLLDFGAARRVISGKTQTLTAILKPAYAPIEQYAETSDVKQGPWTDLYALGATLHYMLLGHPPAPATARAVGNEATILSQRGVADCSPRLLGLIEWMLAPRPADRPRSAAEVRAVLEGRQPLPPRVARARSRPSPAQEVMPVVTVPLDGASRAAAEPALRALEAQAERVGDPDLVPGIEHSGEPGRDRGGGRRRRARSRPGGRAVGLDERIEEGAEEGVEAPRLGEQAPAAANDTLRADFSQRLPPPPPRSRWLPLALAGAVLAGLLVYVGWSRVGGPGRVAPASARAVAPDRALAALKDSAVTALHDGVVAVRP